MCCFIMFRLQIILILLKIIAVNTDRSFTVVLDTTESMRDEINIIKANIGQVVNSINRTDISSYVLVSFKDMNIQAPFVTNSPRQFTSHLSTITTGGGNDCPENSLAGIEAALRASQYESFVFVFTDAYAKDYDRLQSVQNLCKESHSQVIIFLSGFCLSPRTAPVGNVDVYYDIVKTCSGSLFKLDTAYELRNVFSFMKNVINTDWNNISPMEKIRDRYEIPFSVDSFTTDFLIGISGSNPSLQITDSNSQSKSADRVLSTRNALVVHMNQPDPGQYSATIRGTGDMFVTLYERSYIPFQYGFSTKMPRTLMETSLRPIAGVPNYVMISINTAIKLDSIEWLSAGENAKTILYLDERKPGLYVSNQCTVEMGKTFRIWIIGQDTYTKESIRGSTKYITPQVPVTNVTWTRPEVEILDNGLLLVDYSTDLILTCKITGYPKPVIRWEDGNGLELPAEDIPLEIPLVHLSYVTVTDVKENSTIYCKAENLNGGATHSVNIYVNRTFSFDAVETPEDTIVEYGNDLSLTCQVTAYPEASIEWRLNGTKIDPYFNSKATIENSKVTVRNVSLDDGGTYECVASNDVEYRTYSAIITISGLEAPKVESSETEIVLRSGDWIDIECSASGKPVPSVHWQFKAFEAFDYDDLPSSSVDSGKVKITSADSQHVGLYKCTASNVLGDDYKVVTLKVQNAPTIKNSEVERMTVREDDNVLLECEVEAIPAALVRWELTQDDVIIALGDRHRTDDKHALQFSALWNDSGNYHCIAENSIGRAEKTVTVNVLVAPYIESPVSELVQSKIGGNIDLACNVLYGNPAPRIKWEFITLDSKTHVLGGNTTLHLENVSQSDEGSYLCIAENEINKDRIKYTIKQRFMDVYSTKRFRYIRNDTIVFR